MTDKTRNAAITAKIKRYTQEHIATKDLAFEAIQRAKMTNKTEAMDHLVAQDADLIDGQYGKVHTDGSRSGGQPANPADVQDIVERLRNQDSDQLYIERDEAAAEIERLRAALQQQTQSEALREALKTTPLIGRTESVNDFMARQDAWLKGPYRAALQKQNK